MVEIARLTFDGAYQKAIDKLKEGRVYVDSALVAATIYSRAGDIDNSLQAMKYKIFEMDSVFGLIQDAHYNQMATGRSLMRTREEAMEHKKSVRRLTNWIIGICVAFLIIYIMGRRRLTRIIWDKNKKLKVALERAEESNHMKSAFINNMSHEIRTPLNAIGGFSSVLCQPGIELSEEEKKNMREHITYNVELITTIVNEVLELSKSESEKSLRPDSEMTDVAINDLCRKLLHSRADDSHEGVEFTEKGYIELRCEYDKAARQVRLVVEDTGVGINPEDRDRIFGRFEKASDNFREGIGLGLAISQRLASSIGGEITLDAAYTDGCRFILSIPKP